MSRKKLGIIIFNEDTQECYTHLKELEKSLRLWKDQVQICVLGDGQMDSKFQRLIREMSLSVYPDKSGKTILRAIESLNVEYVYMSMSNLVFGDEFWTKIFSCFEENTEDAYITKCRNWNASLTMKEHNNYINIMESPKKEEKSYYAYHLIHNLFYTYFIRKELFAGLQYDEKLDSMHWSLQIIYWYSCIMALQKEIRTLGQLTLTVRAKEDPFTWDEISNDNKALLFYEHFIEPYFAFCKANPDDKNAKYNLLYYLSKVITYAPKDKQLLISMKEKTDEMLSFMRDEELLLENQYFDRVFKTYMFRNYSWDMVDANKAKRDIVLDESRLENVFLFIHLKKDKVCLEGRSMLYGSEPFEIQIVSGNKTFPCKIEKKVVFDKWFHQKISRMQFYSCEIPLKAGKSTRLRVVCKKGTQVIKKSILSYSVYTPFVKELELYGHRNGWIASKSKKPYELCILPATFRNRLKMTWKRELSFWKAGKREQKALRVRAVFHVLHACKRKEIWLISDRISRADDNGECFFRYLQENPQKNIIPYFVMDKNCPDYDRMKQYGKVIPVYSWKHKLAHLLCDCILSSQANKPVLNPFGNFAYLYKDLLYDKKFVFLQHGVTKDDQSAWLNRYNRNMYGFVVATRDEYASIFESEYFYSPDNVWLTGMPRYDRLYRDEQKYITIMPTWRKSLSGGVTSKGEWTIGDTFAESNYFKFYNALLSHPRLLDAAQERGYQVCFMPHPNITPAIPLFDHDPRVNFWKADKSYRDVFAQSDLIVTDYSSVAFDFAYLRKPLVYAQFDREEFFSGSHSYTEGYFNYQTDGFGEIKENMEDLVDCLIEYMDNGCQLKEEYRERIERTFAFADQNCCARVLEKMLEIHEK